jgi:transcriptional regulator GlxA family with amidase domain
MLAQSSDPLDIDILIVPDTTLMLFSSVIEPLRVANRILGEDLFSWRIFSPDGQAVMTASRIPLPVQGSIHSARSDHPLFVIASYQWQKSVTPSLKAALARAARDRPFVVGVESGSWLLAEAGLLNDHTITMHWEDRDDFRARYPHVTVVNERFVIDGRRITTGGSLPTLDFMLDIIRRRHGYSLALEVSRLFIYETEGVASQQNSMPSVNALSRLDPRVRAALKLMEDSLQTPLPIDRLARRIGVSSRHLQDLFIADLNVTPHVHYLALRMNDARRRVIETQADLSDVAIATGFNSPSAFARSYRAHFNESASETRRRL